MNRATMLGNVGQKAFRALDSFGPTEAGGRADRACSEGCGREDRGRAREAQEKRGALEPLKSVDNSFDFVDHCIQRIRANRITERTLRERTCGELYHHGCFAFNLRLRRERRSEARPTYFSLSIGFPIGNGKRLPFFENRSIDECYGAISHMGYRRSDNMVLVGVREFSNEIEGVAERVFLSMERLHPVQQVQAVDNARQTFSGDCLQLVTSPNIVTDFFDEDRELMLLGPPSLTFLDERGNDIVERTPEAMYQVANNNAELMFTDLAHRKVNDTPAVFVDLTEAEFARCVLVHRPIGPMNFSQERFEVFARPCDLCA